MSANILTAEERQRLTTIPSEIHDVELVRFFTVTQADRSAIDQRLRPAYRLDQMAHICILRWLGWSPSVVDRLPEPARVALCRQLGLETRDQTLQPPAARTSRLHAERARLHLGWRKYTSKLASALAQWLQALAAEHDHAAALFEALCQHLYHEHIVRPGLACLERLVETTRNTLRDGIAQGVTAQLTAAQKQQLDALLVVPAGEARSPLQRFKETPARASGPEVLEVLEKVAALRALGLKPLAPGAGQIHPNRVKLLAQRARQRSNWLTAQLPPPQRYVLLVCFLDQALHDHVELAAAMYVEIIHNIFQRAETKRNREVVERGKSLNDKVLLLARLARLVLDEANVPDTRLRQAIYGAIPRERLAHAMRECDEIAQPPDYAPLTFAARSYAYLRQFGPPFLNALEFRAEEPEHPLLVAIAFMHAVERGQRAFASVAGAGEAPPLQFVPWRWKPYVLDEHQGVNRPMYELCLHDCLARAIEHGEVWVADSRTYTSFKSDWIADGDWPAARQAFLAKFPNLADGEVFLRRAQTALDAQMAEANRVWPDLREEVWIEHDTVHLARLEARELPDGVARLQERLAGRFPRIGIAQLLLEVNHWTGVDRLLTNLNAQEHAAENLTAKKMAVLLAEGLNIGLQNMSYCVRGMSYAELAGVYDRYFREDTLRRAVVAVVNFYHRLPITRHWGDGTASSSDGQLFGVPVKTVYAQYHPESPSKSGRALSLYTHVSDHGIPFYGQVIHHLSQEGAYVLDGLLHHETELAPARHFVDTGGYQDVLWGACDLLGFSLEPRIRDIGDMRLFRMRRKVDEYEHIRALLATPINTRAIRDNWESVLRLVASIQRGVVPAARVLSKLDAYHRESGLYTALREIGRIAKTRFLLRYFTQKDVRRQVQRGLNRQESFHALVRALCVGQAGEFRLRELEAQVNRATCLQLVTAMVITWNAAYLTAAVEQLRAEGATVAPEQLAHILPTMSEHINRLGSYEFDARAASVHTNIAMLPLRSVVEMAEQLGLGI